MKTVIVTGGNRGIGLEICRQLDELGYRVILGSRSIEKGVNAAKKISENVIVKQLDVTDEASVLNLHNFVKSEFGKLDILVNNAGLGEIFDTSSLKTGIKDSIKKNFGGVYKFAKKINTVLGKSGVNLQGENATNVSLSDVKTIMETNFYGPWNMIQIFVPLLSKSDSGRIINVSSGMGQLNSLTGFYPGYSLSKSSLNALTIMFSNELKEKGIKVNAICPGWVRTDMGGTDAPLDVSQGADTAVWLATNEELPSGKFYKERQEIDW